GALSLCGIDGNRPLIGAFGPLLEGHGASLAVQAYQAARRSVRGLQLALVESPGTAIAGPWANVDALLTAAGGDPDVHIFPAEYGLGVPEVNALQRACTLVLQLQVPAGFSLELLECQWKEKPAVVGRS